MATNIVCSDTYIDAFSRLDKKIQKKSLETIRLMQRSLRSDSLKVEKLNTKLDFKSARVTQDFRAIFTQSGNTVLLVYIDHHDDAYLWASRRLQGFDTASAKPAYEYFEQSKLTFDPITGEDLRSSDSRESVRPPKEEKLKKGKIDPSTGLPIDEAQRRMNNPVLGNICADPAPPSPKPSLWQSLKKYLFPLFFFILGFIAGGIYTIIYFM